MLATSKARSNWVTLVGDLDGPEAETPVIAAPEAETPVIGEPDAANLSVH